ncbi:23S rRNA (guanosine(2251)-2'-O)-methyltransferase RlmB [Amphritea balenae]|uniref:23S rRNA (guanosine-2'-O-)-methyltransferase RlmB n=1 Tax=Amphritea balenae TaxID=452629 RepID=A0A3P1SMB0_9GAMM|nr:23S rRNA (guanosine(2251)-2'-O)-methyltransferase RlmB [Amphritea balenae]RRC98373.1 23S rRNA (guanosine(2251)-2'-O)-methyltransferase RlmB [Amphritea balenae]GGK81379.1 23S rRNA (guanosine-2'-O-)-methyltransferase RlmB [Amphritea balenae]
MRAEYIFGIHAVTTAVQRDAKRIKGMWVQKGRTDTKVQKLLDLAKAENIRIEWTDRKELDAMAEGGVHQGVVVACEPIQAKNDQFLDAMLDKLEEPAFLLILDGVTDPHNLGACLRTADAAGVHAVIAPKDKSAPLNATVSKVACGAAEVVPYVLVTNLARTMKDLQQKGIWITGTAGESEVLVYDADLKGPMALVMGAEGKGMRRLTREHCDHLIKIDMAGEVSSLNVSVATGVCLFEAVRQRKA